MYLSKIVSPVKGKEFHKDESDPVGQYLFEKIFEDFLNPPSPLRSKEHPIDSGNFRRLNRWEGGQ